MMPKVCIILAMLLGQMYITSVLAQDECPAVPCIRRYIHLSPISVGARDPPYACQGENVTFTCQVINGVALQWASEPDICRIVPFTYSTADDEGEVRFKTTERGFYLSTLVSVARDIPYSNLSSNFTFTPNGSVSNIMVQCGNELSVCPSAQANSTINYADAPSVTQDMLQWQIIEGFPNISIVIEFNIPEDNIVTKLSYSLSVFSSLGLELQVLERSLNTTLSCDTKYWVIGTVSNDCGSDNVTVTIPPQVCESPVPPTACTSSPLLEWHISLIVISMFFLVVGAAISVIIAVCRMMGRLRNPTFSLVMAVSGGILFLIGLAFWIAEACLVFDPPNGNTCDPDWRRTHEALIVTGTVFATLTVVVSSIRPFISIMSMMRNCCGCTTPTAEQAP